ncbi:bifunctional [glutamate--ammonia ligase]-adenylyl-L-tyrosine phosphorylase/[glutamate--ammonia-ligase] adenylyltransferase [Novosphingobium sp. Gsoil 351]|uniref:bifunctional [glutamate--ammonia ligase]-adenylyl-L-tyrosine phosphorylase/[glutamate--ammonia-ligase] adenylyltransferase n=1 Tax=Novosphingobium sp. Gsoil 351 TaxID=2675225 RepID=UPI0012B443CC|nr:bifunctional [glutamate--ammonia ligase]-adenylyl-L-tyrosine phosphorylase/[glutamate--ammonia-ligase] adenylyltransferase [Novosphingobium sp. Gsoil 351]QGN55064.1 bifunctional [glutamate--ammonia ligase]-adenylyl-L-tyrosine phosphorylase/[glutamate--ammonia-ligase] adenylyltransferase [Novosphingobium sp. Gsoil 351]
MANAALFSDAIERARSHAPFLASALDVLPELRETLAAGRIDEALLMARAAGDDAPDLGVALRRERLALALALAIGDLAGALPLARVVEELSAFADRALDAAIADGIRRRVPDAEPAGFSAIALGKHGARELNYSSDIDPILLFDPATLPRRDRDEPGAAAQRVARAVVETLGRVDAEGYVFRVDLRLRPASEVSPLALPFEAAIGHYESSALAWERAAFIRARAASGDIAAGEDFLRTIRPFVWRRSLDFGAIDEIGRLTTRIRGAYAGGQAVGPGYDLKRGRGGIREIEFFAQTHQLIHGGRRPELRLRGTRAALDALAEAGIVAGEDARILGESYDRLRTIEHRLQMVADQQTHALPADAEGLDGVARLDGLAGGGVLIAELAAISEAVGARFDALVASYAASQAPAAYTPAPTDPFAIRAAGWTGDRFRALRSPEAREAFARILPALCEALAGAPDPERALVRWETLLAALPSAINVFRLLEARPALLALLVRILAHAPGLADELTRRVELLDPLIDRSAFDLPGSVATIAAGLLPHERGADYQQVLDTVRREVGERRFALGAQLVEGASDALAVAGALSRIAEAAIAVLGAAAVAEFEGIHGKVPGSRLAILGLGRLGGGALTHASDLDLVFLFSGEHTGESDGKRPLGATLYFNRLAQRVIAALSVPTAAGALYEVDVRLRPSGAQGPIAVSFASFARYQREEAWTWEHMALTRARAVFGTDEDRGELDAVIGAVLAKTRDDAELRGEVLAMRAEMAAHKPPRGSLDAKLSRGGLVDLEFLVHFLQLRDRVGLTPDLGAACDALAQAGVLAAQVRRAHDLMTRMLVAGRLFAPDGDYPPPASRELVARAAGCAGWQTLLDEFAAARETVAGEWLRVFGSALEIDR